LLKLLLRFVPKGIQERGAPIVDRIGEHVRDFEWTWTKAVVISLGLWLIGIIGIGVIPSWWLYFADQKLGWRASRFWLFKARDLVAILLWNGPFVTFILFGYYIQKWRRRLRSESESRPVGGYR
jgi:hypothetical protein